MSSELGFRIGVGFGLCCFFFFFFYLFFFYLPFHLLARRWIPDRKDFSSCLLFCLYQIPHHSLAFFFFPHSHHFFLCLNSYLSCHAICYREEKRDGLDGLDGWNNGRKRVE